LICASPIHPDWPGRLDSLIALGPPGAPSGSRRG
jgi:hypothetical protein